MMLYVVWFNSRLHLWARFYSVGGKLVEGAWKEWERSTSWALAVSVRTSAEVQRGVAGLGRDWWKSLLKTLNAVTNTDSLGSSSVSHMYWRPHTAEVFPMLTEKEAGWDIVSKEFGTNTKFQFHVYPFELVQTSQRVLKIYLPAVFILIYLIWFVPWSMNLL